MTLDQVRKYATDLSLPDEFISALIADLHPDKNGKLSREEFYPALKALLSAAERWESVRQLIEERKKAVYVRKYTPDLNPLKEYREKAKLSQSQLAEMAGISVRTLQDYEQGRKPLEGARAITVLTLARSLSCTVEDLIDPQKGHRPLVDREKWEAFQARIKGNQSAPPGYGWDENGKLVVNEQEAEKVRSAMVQILEDN